MVINILTSLLTFSFICLISLGFGLIFTNRINRLFTVLEGVVVGLIVGIVVWMLLIYLTAWFNIRSLSLILFLIGSFIGWRKYRHGLFSNKIQIDWLLIGLLTVGVLGQLFLVAPSGLIFADGMRFYGVNSHDGMWHVTLMQSLTSIFPPELPTYSGIPLKGYHFLIDLWGSELIRAFHIPAVDLTFRLFPLLFSLLTGFGVFALLKRLTKTKIAPYFGVFLAYFAGSFGYILSLIGHKGHTLETAFWAQQSITTFINLPLGASFALISVILMLTTIYFKYNQDIRLLWLASLLSGISISIKAYGGILIVGAFCLTLFIYGVLKRKLTVYGPILLTLLLTLLFIVPQLRPGFGSFLYQPGWFLKTMMETPDHVNYPLWELQRQTYAQHNNVLRVAQYWIVAFLIFLIGNMGIRVIGFMLLLGKFIKRKVKLEYELLTPLLIVMGGIAIPMLYLQTGIVWNSIQFTYYSLFVMNIFTAMAIDQISNGRLRIIIIIVLIALTVPTTFNTIGLYYKGYVENDNYFLIPNEELQALSFIKSLPNTSKLLTAYSYESYVSALTGKTVYFVDETQAMILLLPIDRKPLITRIFCHDPSDGEVKELMETNKLKYIFTTKSKNVDCHPNFDNNPFLIKVFSNQLSTVYKLK